MKPKYYWKVVRIAGPEYKERTFLSSNRNSPVQLQYKIGVKTVPEFGKIFVFKSRELARKWKHKAIDFDMSNDMRIMKVEVVGKCVSGSYMSYMCVSPGTLRSFWVKYTVQMRDDWSIICPKGTYYADAVIPVSFD